MLIKEIKGDFNNCVGFPGQVSLSVQSLLLSQLADHCLALTKAFFAWLGELTEEGTLCELD